MQFHEKLSRLDCTVRLVLADDQRNLKDENDSAMRRLAKKFILRLVQ